MKRILALLLAAGVAAVVSRRLTQDDENVWTEATAAPDLR
jgi:hypothetical protein